MNSITRILIAGLLLAGLASAQEVNSDPTQPSVAMQDALRTQLDGLREVQLKAAVIAGGGGGVAQLTLPGGETTMVRSNSAFTIAVAGLTLKVRVLEVDATGVTIEAPTLKESVRLATLSGGVPMTGDSTQELRHVEFHNVPLKDALQMLAEETSGNFSTSADAGSQPVSLYLRHVPAAVAVEEICKTHNLWFRRDEQTGIQRVLTMEEYQRDLGSFREETDEVFTLMYPNVMEVAVAIKALYGDRVRFSYPQEESADWQDLQARFDRFNLVNRNSQSLNDNAENSGGIGTTVLAGESGAVYSSSGSGSAYFATPQPASATPTQAPVVRNLTPERVQQMERARARGTNEAAQAMESLREQPANIAVTASRRNNLLIVRTSDAQALEDIRSLVRRMDIPTPMVLLEVKILRLNLGDGFRSVFDLQFADVLGQGEDTSLLNGGFTTGEILPPLAGSMTPGGTGLKAGDMTFQVVNQYFRARLQLLENENRVTALATPMLLTANNEVSRLFLGEERPLVRGITGQTIITDNSTAVTPNTEIEFRLVGTTLLITPNINADRTVTLRLVQENSSINAGGASIPIVVASGTVQNVSIDVVASKSISGTFVAKDNMAVAVGGLIEEQISNVEERVPFLSRIPLLGYFFKRTTRAKTRQELIVLIRPHVMLTPSESGGISRNVVRDISLHPSAPDGKPTLHTFENDRPKADKPVPKR